MYPSTLLSSLRPSPTYRRIPSVWAAVKGAGHQRGPYLRRSRSFNGHTVLDGLSQVFSGQFNFKFKYIRVRRRIGGCGVKLQRLKGEVDNPIPLS
jgi:hypothetical protein